VASVVETLSVPLCTSVVKIFFVSSVVLFALGHEHAYGAPRGVVIGGHHDARIHAFAVLCILRLIEITLRAYRHSHHK